MGLKYGLDNFFLKMGDGPFFISCQIQPDIVFPEPKNHLFQVSV